MHIICKYTFDQHKIDANQLILKKAKTKTCTTLFVSVMFTMSLNLETDPTKMSFVHKTYEDRHGTA